MTTAVPISLADASLPARHAQPYVHPADEHGFDFFFGHWVGSNRRMLAPLSGKDEWETFKGSCFCQPILGGLGNQEEFVTAHRPGYVGMALRLFDRDEACWRIYWLDNRTLTRVEEPVKGRFVGSMGIFECEEDYHGRRIHVRYTWSRLDTPNPRWEQAFSIDDGTSREINWTADFHRADGGLPQ